MESLTARLLDAITDTYSNKTRESWARASRSVLADHLLGGLRYGLEAAFVLTLPAVTLSGLLVRAAVPFDRKEARAEARSDVQPASRTHPTDT